MLISIAQGRIDTARHLISFHPQKNQSAFRAVDEQLRTMPNFAVNLPFTNNKIKLIFTLLKCFNESYLDFVSFVSVWVQDKVGDMAEKVHSSAHKWEFCGRRNGHSRNNLQSICTKIAISNLYRWIEKSSCFIRCFAPMRAHFLNLNLSITIGTTCWSRIFRTRIRRSISVTCTYI